MVCVRHSLTVDRHIADIVLSQNTRDDRRYRESYIRQELGGCKGCCGQTQIPRGY